MAQDLRARIRAKELLIGTFIKTPSPQSVEILGAAGLDFAVIDQEHAPIGIAQMDMMALASRAAGMPVLSRRWGASRDWIAPLLDLGLAGVMVPHVMDGADARSVCDAVRFSRGKRGLSPSPRAGNYGGMTLADYRSHCDASSVVMVQIEDASALDALDEIAAIDDVDMLFVGPADLAQSMQVSYPSDVLDEAILRVAAAGLKHNKAVGLFVSNAAQIPDWHAKGVTLFVCGSDQSMLKGAAIRLASAGRS